jgi:hypothetical protein
MRSRTALGHDQRLIYEIGDGHALLRRGRMMIWDRDDGCLMKERHEFQPFVRALRKGSRFSLGRNGAPPAIGLPLRILCTDVRSRRIISLCTHPPR